MHLLRHSFAMSLLAAALTAVAPAELEGQLLNRIRNRVQREVENKIEDSAARAARSLVNAAEDAIVCAVTNTQCIEEARAQSKELVIVDGDNKVVGHENVPPAPASAAAPETSAADVHALRPGEGAWANYDFVPGERVLFYDDMALDFVGDFPRRLEFRQGAMEIVEWQNERFLRVGSRDATFDVVLPEVLPDRFTLEFDFFMGAYANWLYIYPVDENGERVGDNYVGSGTNHALEVYSHSEKGVTSDMPAPKLKTDIVPVRLMMDGSYLKLFAGEQRVANIPNADFGRSNRLRFEFESIESSNPALLRNIRVAAGGREMLYDRLVRDGRVVTGGILFETGSAQLLPESTPTLNDLVQALGRDPSMRVRVEGHTDDVGQPELNQRLSEDRARAVVEYLTTQGGIAASRLEAVGMGQTRPAADNTSPEGRQTNRRVEVAVIG